MQSVSLIWGRRSCVETTPPVTTTRGGYFWPGFERIFSHYFCWICWRGHILWPRTLPTISASRVTESFISEQQARSVNTQKNCLDSGRGGDGKSFREGRKGKKRWWKTEEPSENREVRKWGCEAKQIWTSYKLRCHKWLKRSGKGGERRNAHKRRARISFVSSYSVNCIFTSGVVYLSVPAQLYKYIKHKGQIFLLGFVDFQSSVCVCVWVSVQICRCFLSVIPHIRARVRDK